MIFIVQNYGNALGVSTGRWALGRPSSESARASAVRGRSTVATTVAAAISSSSAVLKS